jgi:hypothetical protein
MEKIKNLHDVLLPDMGVLVEIIAPKRYILKPDGAKDEDSYAIVIAVHPHITDLEIGDYVIKYMGTIWGYTANQGSSNEKTYGIMYRSNINLAVKPHNFIDPDKVTEKVNV